MGWMDGWHVRMDAPGVTRPDREFALLITRPHDRRSAPMCSITGFLTGDKNHARDI